MPDSTIRNSIITNSTCPYIITEYSCPGIGADTTSVELISIELRGQAKNERSYRNLPNRDSSGNSYCIELLGFSISCNSENYDISILNKNDIDSLDTIYEIIKYTGINKSTNDTTFDRLVIRNRDAALLPNLYLYVNNHDNIETGLISLELVYISIQDEIF